MQQVRRVRRAGERKELERMGSALEVQLSVLHKCLDMMNLLVTRSEGTQFYCDFVPSFRTCYITSFVGTVCD